MIPTERDPIPTVQGAGWASGPVWEGAENLSPIRTPGCPTCIQSLYYANSAHGVTYML
jgi:hypothetical protein